MKLFGAVLLALVLTGCASTQPISFSPSEDYAVSVRSALFDAVRIEKSDTTLFREGKSIGFIPLKSVPDNVASASDFLSTLKSESTSEAVQMKPLSFSSGFTGFTAAYRNYVTGYLLSVENPDSILIVSFPENEFDDIVKTISTGI